MNKAGMRLAWSLMMMMITMIMDECDDERCEGMCDKLSRFLCTVTMSEDWRVRIVLLFGVEISSSLTHRTRVHVCESVEVILFHQSIWQRVFHKGIHWLLSSESSVNL